MSFDSLSGSSNYELELTKLVKDEVDAEVKERALKEKV